MFCGRSDLNAEDAWPKWLRKVLPEQDWPFASGTTHPFTHEFVVEREWLKRKLEVRVREFCKNECNGGWMSRLEMAASPILTPMFQGQRRTLNPSQQKLVAFWATKTAFTLERTTSHPVIPRRQYELLYEEKAPLRGIYVFLASYLGRQLVSHESGPLRTDISVTEIGPSVPQVNTESYSATLLVGHLVLQVLRVSEGDHVALTALAEPGEGMRKLPFIFLWPSTGAETIWPPAAVLDDAGLYRFSRLPAVETPGFFRGNSVGGSWLLSLSRILPPRG